MTVGRRSARFAEITNAGAVAHEVDVGPANEREATEAGAAARLWIARLRTHRCGVCRGVAGTAAAVVGADRGAGCSDCVGAENVSGRNADRLRRSKCDFARVGRQARQSSRTVRSALAKRRATLKRSGTGRCRSCWHSRTAFRCRHRSSLWSRRLACTHAPLGSPEPPCTPWCKTHFRRLGRGTNPCRTSRARSSHRGAPLSSGAHASATQKCSSAHSLSVEQLFEQKPRDTNVIDAQRAGAISEVRASVEIAPSTDGDVNGSIDGGGVRVGRVGVGELPWGHRRSPSRAHDQNREPSRRAPLRSHRQSNHVWGA